MSGFVKKMILLGVAIALVATTIIGNIVLGINANTIHTWFAGSGTSFEGEEVENVLTNSDKLVQEIAEDSMTLLKNQNSTLPFKQKDNLKVNLFGWGASDAGFLLAGGGSGGVYISDEKKITLSKAFEQENIQCNKDLLDAYAEYSTYDADGYRVTQSKSVLVQPGAEFYTDEIINNAKNFSDIAIVVLSRFGKENGGEMPLTQPKSINGSSITSTDKTRTFLETSTEEDALLDIVCENFGTVIVLINSGNVMELGFLEDERIDAALFVGQPGQSGALAIPRILKGDITPSGKLSDTWAYDTQTNSSTWANALYRGTANIHYLEGIYMGYRWYETADEEGYFDDVDNEYGKGYEGVVQFPFGYGLSYTDFKWEVIEAPENNSSLSSDGKYSIKVRVTNEGSMNGKDVVQLYSTPPYEGEKSIEKAHMNLIAFEKTELLKPGQSQELTLSFTAYDLASYDDYDKNGNGFKGYELEKGDYVISLRDDVHNKAKCENSVVTLCANNDIYIRRDPVTGEFVKNQFTGDSAYGGVPIDGTTVTNGIKYMTRADFRGTMPTSKAPNANVPSGAPGYIYDDFKEVEKHTYGKDSGLRLVVKSDGSNASLAELSGEVEANLKYNDELLQKLSDYKADEWDDLLDQMTEQDIKDLLGKAGYVIWPVESVGLPRSETHDGPAGFNLIYNAADASAEWSAFPTEATIGCSWNKRLVYNMGRAIGAEGKVTNSIGWNAPGINLHRSPYNSRNYEYYSEDPILSGYLGAEVIRGAKNNGLWCYMKHWAASEAGDNPQNWNTWLNEQTLREIYLKPFEISTKRGGANAIMSAFNRLGCVWTGGNWALSTQILRNEWGFKGVMVTDYFIGSYMDYTQAITAGNDTFLDPNLRSADIDMTNPIYADRARTAAKNMLYTFVDTYVTAKDFAENGDPDDPYKVIIGDIKVNAHPFSPLFVFLWVLIDVVLVAGVAACVFFGFVKKDKAKTAEKL